MGQEGDLRLGCCSGRWRSLGEVYAAIAYTYDRHLSNIEIATWTRRLTYDAGTFAPLDVPVPALPDGTGAPITRGRLGFKLLIGLRWADYARRPVAFSVRFCAAWCRLTHREAHVAILELTRRGVIVQVGVVSRTPLYMPGAAAGDSLPSRGPVTQAGTTNTEATDQSGEDAPPGGTHYRLATAAEEARLERAQGLLSDDPRDEVGMARATLPPPSAGFAS